MTNPFLVRVASQEISTLDELKACYRAELKRLHPDLQGELAPGVDFDRLKKHYHEALKVLLNRQVAPEPTPSSKGLATRDAFLEEFRNLVARGFPINVQAAAKNRAYAASIRLVAAFLTEQFVDPEFFVKVNAETRALKRTDPTIHWYVLQIYWNIGDYRVTGFDYYQRIYRRHLAFIRQPLLDGNYGVLLKMLEYLVDGWDAKVSTREASRSPRPET